MRTTTRQLASPLGVIGFMSVVYYLWFSYDWKFPDLKVIGFVWALGFVYWVVREGQGPRLAPRAVGVEIGLVSLVFLVNTFMMIRIYGHDLFRAPRIDIATTTIESARMLFLHRGNPYASHTIDHLPNLPPEFRGFHYGPVMMLGYAGSLLWTHAGFKATSCVFILFNAVAVVLLVREQSKTRLENIAASVFGVTMLLLPRRFWHDTLALGANDMLPIALAMFSIYFARRQQLDLAGLFAGLSFSAKFSPGVFLILLFARKDLKPAFVIGTAVGLLPVLGFLLWDYSAFMNSVFKMRVLVQFDTTSLYWITPPRFHFLFPLVLYCTVLWVLYRNFKRPLEYRALLLDFTLLLTVAEVTFKQVHTNHFIWFYPLFAVLLTAHRHSLFLPPELRMSEPLEGPARERESEPAAPEVPGAPAGEPPFVTTEG